MKAKGVRLHAANDLRLEEFELPEITDDEILVKVVSDSICMSTYKCAILGTAHKRVHEDVAEHPAIMGHEFAGDIVQVGKNHQTGDEIYTPAGAELQGNHVEPGILLRVLRRGYDILRDSGGGYGARMSSGVQRTCLL